MTEAEWLACKDARVMVDGAPDHDFINAWRKWWLFPVAAVHRLQPQFLDPIRGALEVAARFADDDGTRDKLIETWQALSLPKGTGYVLSGVLWFFESESPNLDDVLNSLANGGSGLAPEEEFAAQADLLREIFGNPFRPVTFSPQWRTDTAVSLARTMYESRDFSAMPILADALQDAGCDSAEILDHCRGPGPHVRGCWVVDLVLGKE
jgi:hypothetical protein